MITIGETTVKVLKEKCEISSNYYIENNAPQTTYRKKERHNNVSSRSNADKQIKNTGKK